jgi:hypothetical protein
MPLPKSKLAQYQKYYRLDCRTIREFDNGMKHPVVLMSECRIGTPRKKNSWMRLMCKCDLTFKWSLCGKPKKRTMVHVGDGYHCPVKEDARKIVRAEVREKYQKPWEAMVLADRVLDIWQKHRAGEYMGERNIGTLYVQDVESLLGTTPEVIKVSLGESRNAQGEVVSPGSVERISFPSREILTAVGELKKRKLVDLNGMILVSYREYFRFPEELHRQFAYWIEAPLGWPNGDAGGCFLAELYGKIARVTGWQSGEEVFGAGNIPALTPYWWARSKENWLPVLDWRFGLPEEEHQEVVRGISIEKWIAWLVMIRREIRDEA